MGSIKNITSSDVDSTGRQLIKSDNIRAVFHYDSRGEFWLKDYSSSQPVSDPYFDVTISGTASPWFAAHDEVAPGSYALSTSRTLFAGDADLIRRHAVSYSRSSKYDRQEDVNALVKWPAPLLNSYYTHTTWAAAGSSGWARFDFGSPHTFNTLMFDWAGMTGRPYTFWWDPYPPTVGVRGWHFDISDDDVSYTTVASGEATYGQIAPVIIDLPDTSTRFVKFYMDSNWGGPCVGIEELGLYDRSLATKSAAMLWGVDYAGVLPDNYGSVKQFVDVTGVDRLFFDFGASTATNPTLHATQGNLVTIAINGDTKFSSAAQPETYSSSSFSPWSYYGYSVDVSEYSGAVAVEVRFKARHLYDGVEDMNRGDGYAWVSRVSSWPTWYDEEPSESRGDVRAFPETATIVVDDAGVSILDSSKYDETGTAQPTLWLRWDNRITYLPFSFTSAHAEEGKIYLGSANGIVVLDFIEDRIDWYGPGGHQRFTGIGNRQAAIYTTTTGRTGTHPSWRTLSTSSSHTLAEGVSCLSGVSGIPGGAVLCGTQKGAVALVSGTLYRSAAKYPVASVDASGGMVVVGFDYGKKSPVGCLWDVSSLGYDSFEYEAYLASSEVQAITSFSGAQSVISSEFSVTQSGTVTTISGQPTTLDREGQRAAFYLGDHVGPAPLLVSADIRIREWPSDCPGEFRLGLVENVGVVGVKAHTDSTSGGYLAARNDYSVPIYSDNFSDGNSDEGNYYLLAHGQPSMPTYTPYEDARGMVFTEGGYAAFNQSRTAYPIGARDCIVRFKVRVYKYNTTHYLWCRITDYTANEAGGNQLQFVVRPALSTSWYGIRSYGSPTSSYTTLPFFGDEGQAEDSEYHDVYLHYEYAAKSMTAYVDGNLVGTATVATLNNNYICFSTSYSYVTGSMLAVVKDFSVDFYNDSHAAKTRRYSVGRISGIERTPEGSQYIWGSPSNPYKSDISRPFFGPEGTVAEGYRRWSFLYDSTGSSYSCYVDSEFIGAGSLSSGLSSPGVFLDAQFFPVTTISGAGSFVADIDNFSVSYLGKSILGLPSDTFGLQLPTTGPVEAVSSTAGAVVTPPLPNSVQRDSTIVVGSLSGLSSISTAVPNFNVSTVKEKFVFSGGAVPTGWSTIDMPGHTGSSSWAVSSGTLKQVGSVAGHGASLSTSDKVRGPFGSHLVTGITTGSIAGSYLTAQLRTTSTGTYGLGVGTVYDTQGTVTVASGSYIVFGQLEARFGQFSSRYDSASGSYAASYTVSYSGTELLAHKTGSIIEVGALTTDSGVDVYVDGHYKHSLPVGDYPAAGNVSLISNGNAFSEFRFVGNVRPEGFSYNQSLGALSAASLYGDSSRVSSLTAIGETTRSSGVLLAGTTGSGTGVSWVKHPQVLATTGSVESRVLAVNDELDEVYVVAYNYTNSQYDYRFKPGVGWATPTTTFSLAKNAAAHDAVLYSGPWPGLQHTLGLVALTPAPHHFAYVMGYENQGGVVDLSAGEVVRWGAEASNDYAADMPFNVFYRYTTYGQPIGGTNGVGDAPTGAAKCGPPTFHWGLGAVIATTGNTGTLNSVLIYPDKHHASSFGPNGDTSTGLDAIGFPPFLVTGGAAWPSAMSIAYDAASDSLYHFSAQGVYALRSRTNSWECLATLPAEVYVANAAFTIVSTAAPSLGKVFVNFAPYQAVHTFNTITDSWDLGFEALPFGVGVNMTGMAFSDKGSSLYVVPREAPSYLYTKVFKKPTPGILFSPLREPNTLPENSLLGKFLWQGAESVVTQADSLDPSGDMQYMYWKATASGTAYPAPFDSNGYVGAGEGCMRVHSATVFNGSNYGRVGGLASRIALPACSFSASLDVRVTELGQHSGAGRNHYCLFGVSAGATAAGTTKAGYGAFYEPGRIIGATGYNGVYMAAAAHADYGEKRYMLLKRDGSAWSDTSATQYASFVGSDGTWGAEFKRWGISYDYHTKTLTATLSGAVLGSTTLTGPMDKLLIEIGAGGPRYSPAEYVNNEHTIEFKNFVSDFNGGVPSVEASSSVLTIDKNVYDNGSYSYKRIFPTVTSGSDFVYESSVSCGRYSASNTPYVFSIGKVSDGHRVMNLCALDQGGSRKVGFWSGLDPWTTTSGFPAVVEHEWQVDSTYKVVRSSGIVNVHINGLPVPELRTDYSWFPRARTWYDRSITFGVDELPAGFVSTVDCVLDNYEGGLVTVSGSWTRQDPFSSGARPHTSWFGKRFFHLSDPGRPDKAVTVQFPEIINDTVYVYYQPSGAVYLADATNAPVTVYAETAFDLPVADAYTSNNVNTVLPATDHLGVPDVGATTILLNQRLHANGGGQTLYHHGQTYLGKYFKPTHAVVTPDADGSVVVGTFFIYDYPPGSRLRNKSRTAWKSVRFEAGVSEFTEEPECGVSFVDSATGALIDYYSDRTAPGLPDGHVSSTSED